MSCILKLNITYTEIWMYHHNWQLPGLNQRKGENGRRNYFMTKLHERMLPDVRIDPTTVRIPDRRASHWATTPDLPYDVSVIDKLMPGFVKIVQARQEKPQPPTHPVLNIPPVGRYYYLQRRTWCICSRQSHARVCRSCPGPVLPVCSTTSCWCNNLSKEKNKCPMEQVRRVFGDN